MDGNTFLHHRVVPRQKTVGGNVSIITELEKLNVNVVHGNPESAWSAQAMRQSVLHGSDNPEKPPPHVNLKRVETIARWILLYCSSPHKYRAVGKVSSQVQPPNMLLF